MTPWLLWLQDVQCVLYSASDRSLNIYDVTTLTHALVHCVTGLPNIPTVNIYSLLVIIASITFYDPLLGEALRIHVFLHAG